MRKKQKVYQLCQIACLFSNYKYNKNIKSVKKISQNNTFLMFLNHFFELLQFFGGNYVLLFDLLKDSIIINW